MAEGNPGVIRRIREWPRVWAPRLVFVLVALVPVLRRFRHPTILGDDITRVVRAYASGFTGIWANTLNR
jgi:hypothetical protein